MKFVFWQNVPNHLQSPWLSALAQRSPDSVAVAVESGNEVEPWRVALGWQLPAYDPATLITSITPELTNAIIESAGNDAVHIFSGVGAYPAVHQAFLQCAKRRLRLGLMAERSYPGGLLAFPRYLKGSLIRYRYGSHIDFVLGVGQGAPVWYKRLGYAQQKVFEFAYYPPLPPVDENASSLHWPGAGVRILYIGQLIMRKGVDLVLSALAQTKGENWCFSLLGTGDKENKFRETVEALGLGEKVHFLGSMPNEKAMEVLAAADLLVLPSRFDGYGAVVNEALFRGVPVICSENVGACQVVQSDARLGSVFSSDATLLTALRRWIDAGSRTPERSRVVKTLSRSVSPESGADYFLKLMSHLYNSDPRPVPPWRQASH